MNGYTRIGIFATKTIEPGEEITYDYQFFTAEKTLCRCGTSKCRGYLSADLSKEMKKQSEQEMKEYGRNNGTERRNTSRTKSNARKGKGKDGLVSSTRNSRGNDRQATESDERMKQTLNDISASSAPMSEKNKRSTTSTNGLKSASDTKSGRNGRKSVQKIERTDVYSSHVIVPHTRTISASSKKAMESSQSAEVHAPTASYSGCISASQPGSENIDNSDPSGGLRRKRERMPTQRVLDQMTDDKFAEAIEQAQTVVYEPSAPRKRVRKTAPLVPTTQTVLTQSSYTQVKPQSLPKKAKPLVPPVPQYFAPPWQQQPLQHHFQSLTALHQQQHQQQQLLQNLLQAANLHGLLQTPVNAVIAPVANQQQSQVAQAQLRALVLQALLRNIQNNQSPAK